MFQAGCFFLGGAFKAPSMWFDCDLILLGYSYQTHQFDHSKKRVVACGKHPYLGHTGMALPAWRKNPTNQPKKHPKHAKNCPQECTLLGIHISHLGKRKIIFEMDFSGDMLVPRRVYNRSPNFLQAKYHPTKPTNQECLENTPLRAMIWVVVSNVFYFHPYLGRWSILTHIFQMGWNHQLVWCWWENFNLENHPKKIQRNRGRPGSLRFLAPRSEGLNPKK